MVLKICDILFFVNYSVIPKFNYFCASIFTYFYLHTDSRKTLHFIWNLILFCQKIKKLSSYLIKPKLKKKHNYIRMNDDICAYPSFWCIFLLFSFLIRASFLFRHQLLVNLCLTVHQSDHKPSFFFKTNNFGSISRKKLNSIFQHFVPTTAIAAASFRVLTFNLIFCHTGWNSHKGINLLLITDWMSLSRSFYLFGMCAFVCLSMCLLNLANSIAKIWFFLL